MHKLTILVFMFLVCLPISFAFFNYSELGEPDGTYTRGNSLFNSVIDFDLAIDGTPRSLGLGRKTPLVQDLNGDGQNEIIVLDTSTIRIYHDKELVPNQTISIPNVGDNANMIAFDVDNDSLIEILIGVHSANETIYIFEYNESFSFTLQNQIPINSTSHTTGEFLIKCGEPEQCLVAYPHVDTSVAGASQFFVRSFNSTHSGIETLIDTSGNAYVFCFSKSPNMQYIDYDSDGRLEYVFSAGMLGGGVGNEFAGLYYVESNATTGLSTLENEISIDMGDVVGTGAGTLCSDDIGRHITNPLVTDFEVGGSLETVIGYSVDSNEFQIDAYNLAGNQIPQAPFPETFLGDADGEIISNLIEINAFSDTTNPDVCVLGFDSTDNKLDLLCANPQAGVSQSREHILEVSSVHNFTMSYNQHSSLIHAIQADGSGLDEVISTVGTLRMDWSSICLITSGCLSLIWANPVLNSTVVSVDAEKIGLEDLLVLTNSNIWYFDDGFSFSGAVIQNYSINPCIESVWKVSNASNDNITRTAEIRIRPVDPDGDIVSSRATLYHGRTFNQTSEWIAGASGTTTLFGNFVINETITTGTIRLEANDTSNPTEIDTIDVTFTVSTDGVELDDCVTTVSVAPVDDEGLTEEQQFQQNNTITNSIEQVKGVANLNISNTIIWLIIMAVVAGITISGMSQVRNVTGTQISISVVSLQFILFLIGIALGFLEVIFLWVMIILALAIIGFKIFRPIVTGG